MSLILQNVFPLFNKIIRSNAENSDLETKMLGVNEGNIHLVRRMIQLTQDGPGDFLNIGTNLNTTINTNYSALPSDFLSLHSFHRRLGAGTGFYKLSNKCIYSLAKLQDYKEPNFYDTSDKGDIEYIAVKEPNIYFDRYRSSTETDRVKISYFKKPVTLEAYDKIPITSVTGTFQVGETITGSNSGATATIHTVAATYLYITSSSRAGIFIDAETITGNTSGATATQSGSMEEKPQDIVWSEQFRMLVAEAWALGYFIVKSSDEAEEKSGIVDVLIRQLSEINPGGSITIGIA